MKVGDLSVDIVSDGTLLVDGGSLFGQVPKTIWEQKMKADRKNRIKLGINCLLIQALDKNILVDTGVGSKEPERIKEWYGLRCNKLLTNLKACGLLARQIDMVILSHLHFDHAGGATKIDRTGRATPTFPKATYVVQRRCWEEALDPSERTKASFHPDDFLPLEEKGQLSLIDGNCEIVPGVSIRVTNGHSSGHQAVIVNSGGERIAYAGDLIPTAHHVPLAHVTAFELSPEDSVKEKRSFLEMAQKEGWLLIFSHGFEQKSGYVESINGKIQLRLVDF